MFTLATKNTPHLQYYKQYKAQNHDISLLLLTDQLRKEIQTLEHNPTAKEMATTQNNAIHLHTQINSNRSPHSTITARIVS